jgi:hypothetical protein
MLVEMTPEEAVRQGFVQRLLGRYDIPRASIRVEYMLGKAGGSSRRRADIVVMSGKTPLLVVECKRPSPLHDGVFEQARGYADELGCNFVALISDGDPEVHHRVGGSWKLVRGFPSFEAMHTERKLVHVEPPSRYRQPFTAKELRDHAVLERHEQLLSDEWSYYVLGDDTPRQLWTPIYGLYNAVFHRRPEAWGIAPRRDAPGVQEHLGLHFREYGNYSGGKFPGLYAAFRVRDARGDDQIHRIGFFSCAHTENDPVFGNRKGTSGVHVAIDDFNATPHMSLELSLDTCIRRRAKGFEVVHDGKITVGRLGAAKRSDLLEYVANRAPRLVRDDVVHLGAFHDDAAPQLEDVKAFVFNLLEYAELRDEFRVKHKAKKR